jgi:Fis family transcriptional regulator, factor for inversion stimulation protein
MELLKLSLEELLYLRLGQFFDQLSGRKVPGLYKVLLDQVDRAVLRQALERCDGQVGTAADFLGVDRNTLARKAKRLKVGARAALVKRVSR